MQSLNYKGQTLIELMTAMTLSLLLLSIMVTIFQSIKANTRYVNALLQIQENMRTVFYLLKADARSPNAEVLNPSQIPASITSRFYQSNAALLLESHQKKIVYFLSRSQQKDDQGQSILELNRKDLAEDSHNQDAIADNIMALHIVYGQTYPNDDSQQQKVLWVSSANVTNWNAVKLIKILLTIRSSRPVEGKRFLQKSINVIVRVN